MTDNIHEDNILDTLDTFKEARAYWLEKLAGELTGTRLPADFAETSLYREAIYDGPFPSGLSGSVMRIGKSNDLAMFTIMLTALKILLFKYTHQPDLFVASPIYTQTNQQYNQWVLFRDVLSGGATFKELLMAVKQTVAGGFKNEHYPVAKLGDALGFPDVSRLTGVAFLLDSIHNENFVTPLNKDILIAIHRKGDSLSASIRYNGALFNEDTIGRFWNHYCRLLDQVLENTGVTVDDIGLLTDEEREQVLVRWNLTGTGSPTGETIHQAFKKQAAETPGEIAVTSVMDALEEIGNCCCKTTPYFYHTDIALPDESGSLVVIKTHLHDVFIVNPNLLHLLKAFNGETNVTAVYEAVKDIPLRFLVHYISIDDMLEISYGVQSRTETHSNDTFEDFLTLIKMLYTHKLIDILEVRLDTPGCDADFIKGFNTEEAPQPDPPKSETNNGSENAKHQTSPKAAHLGGAGGAAPCRSPRRRPRRALGEPPEAGGWDLENLLNRNRELSHADVLLLGDTPGMASVGLLYMGSYLKRHGVDVYCQFNDLHWDYKAYRENIRYLLEKVQPRIVGVSMKWFPHIARSLETCKIIKEFAPDATVVLGGNSASYYSGKVIKDPSVDMVIKGDGELPLLKICQGETDIPNCVMKKEDGETIETPITYVQDQDNSSDIYLSHLDDILISRTSSILGSFFIHTQKGCWMSCFYCAGCRDGQIKTFNRHQAYRREVSEVRKDLIAAKPYTSTFQFEFEASNEELEEYCRQIFEGIDLSNHFCNFLAAFVPSEELVKLVNTTFKYVYWNPDICSFSGRHREQLDNMGVVKPQPTDAEIRACFDLWEKYDNNEVRINTISGLPHFTLEDIEESEKFVDSIMRDYTTLTEMHWGRLHAQPGAPIVEDADGYNMISYASTYEDFLKCSQSNLRDHDVYPSFEDVNYPFIYYKDEELNVRVSKHYSDLTLKLKQYRQREAKKELRVVGKNISYRELDERSDRLAGHLQQSGVGPDTIVALLMEASVEMVVSLLAVLKAGGAYLPIDPQYPEERIKYILADSGAGQMVTLKKMFPDVGDVKRRFALDCVLAADDDALYAGDDTAAVPLEDRVRPGNLAYVIYTSGTTGNPKGVLVEHKGMVNYALWRKNTYRLTPADVTLQPLSYCFDGFGANLYSTLLSGGTIVMVPDQRRMDFDYMKETLKYAGVTNISLVPGMYRELLEGTEAEDIETLRFVVLGGEKAGMDLIGLSNEKAPAIGLFNEYGPTETTVTAVAHQELETLDSSIIGSPIDNTAIFILDKSGEPVVVGSPGELLISGVGLARGYLNNPLMTAETFIPNPFIASLSGKSDNMYLSPALYRTGDLARWEPDGTIRFLGRVDSQVKIRGFRIELGEIRQQLLNHPLIKDAVVQARVMGDETGDAEDGEKALCAYVVTEKPFDTLELELKEFLADRLPDYMVPALWIPLDAIPLTPNGKVDTRALPAPDAGRGTEYVAPRDKLEESLVKIMADVLSIDEARSPLGIDDNFFEMGGHSLKATRLLSRIHKDLDVKIHLTRLFEEPTIRDLAQHIRESGGEMGAEVYAAIQPAEIRPHYPLASAQKRLYVLQQMEEGNTHYNMPLNVPLAAGVDKARLAETFRQLIRRHDSLRTSFRLVADEPVQVVHAFEDVVFDVEYYMSAQSTVGEAAAVELRGVEAIVGDFVRPFDLSRPPLMRVGLVDRGERGPLLMVDLHHIITDAASQVILIEEFRRLHAGETLEPLELQYKDFACWSVLHDRDADIRQQESYWLGVFDGELPVLSLPTDFPRPLKQSFRGRTVDFSLPADTGDGLRKLAEEKGGTLYIVVLAVYYALLSRWSGQEDIIIGVPVEARRHAQLENIIGMFVNTLALRNRPSGTLSFDRFLEDVKGQTLAAFENQEYPFEDLADKLTISRDSGRNPLFDVMFNQVLAPSGELPLAQGSGGSGVYRHRESTAKFDMMLTLIAREQGELSFSLEYCADLFKAPTAEGMIDSFKRLVQLLLEPGNRQCPLHQLDLLAVEGRRRLLEEYGPNAAPYPEEKSIRQLFEEEVQKAPQRTALVWLGDNPAASQEKEQEKGQEKEILTYGQLNERANCLAHRLIEMGVGPDVIVGLVVERSIWHIVGILAILKAGGAYMPIDPNYPEPRIRYMLTDSAVKLILAQEAYMDKASIHEALNEAGCENMLVNMEDESIYAGKRVKKDNPGVLNGAGDLAYIMYTSGSTGGPKGVMVIHRNVTRLVKNTDFISLSPATRVLLTGAPVFDATTIEIWGPLLNGGSLVLASRDVILDAQRLGPALKENNVNTLWLSAPLFNQLMQQDEGIFSQLRYLLVGGDALTPDYINRVRKTSKELQVINGYGPTENTTFSVCFNINKDYDVNIPIGRPIRNSSVYITDGYGNLQLEGAVGELLVGGHGVARGYLNSPEMTHDKFIPNPFTQQKSEIQNGSESPTHRRSPEPCNMGVQGEPPPGARRVGAPGGPPEARLYKTGDLARWLPGGIIEFGGRKDFQVKIRGFRIELGEIENRIVNFESVKEAAVITGDDGKGDKWLCAYVVFNEVPGEGDEAGLVAELKGYLSGLLPDYMLPSYFVSLERIPLTRNGKVDRRALPEPDAAGLQKHVGPLTGGEVKLAAIWSEVLGIPADRIGAESDFFDLGGHSLKATLLINKMHETFQVRVPLSEIFVRSQLAELAQYLQSAVSDGYQAIERVEPEAYYPQSSAQKRLFFLSRFENVGTSYNMPSVYWIHQEPDKERLEETLRTLIDRHEALRTSFHLENDEPVQVVHEDVSFGLEYFEAPACTGSDKADRDREKAANAAALIGEFIRPFDLKEAPLFRAGLARMGEASYLLMIDMHHIIGDGTSMGILGSEFARIYNGEVLEPLRIQYKDFAVWQNGMFKTGKIKKQEDYWLNIYSDVENLPVINFPTDFPRPDVMSFEGDHYSFQLDPETTLKFQELARENGATMYMNLLAVLNVLLYKYTGQTDIIVGSGIMGRPHSDLKDIIGMFVNTLAMRSLVEPGMTYEVLLQQVKDATLEAFENQELQFEELVDKMNLGQKRKAANNPLFDILFMVQNFERGDTQGKGNGGGLVITPYKFEHKTSKFDLVFFANEIGGRLNCSLEYSTRLFKPATIEKIGERYLEIIRQVVADKTIRLEDITLSHQVTALKSEIVIEDDDDFGF